MAKKNNDFDLVNLPEAAQDPEIKQEDFVLQQADKEIHEQRFQTKPTTFFKDSLKRFSKNKSSVVAAYILGFLILLSIAVPIFSPYDVSTGAGDIAFNYLQPKLFDGGTGFWDGTVQKTHIPVDTSKGDNKEDWWPNPTYYKKSGISNYQVGDFEFTTDITEYGKGGYARIGYYSGYGLSSARLDSVVSQDINFVPELDLTHTTLTLTNFETVNEEKIMAYYEADESAPKELPEHVIPENFELGTTTLLFNYIDEDISETDYQTIQLVDKKVIHNVGSTLVNATDTAPIVISDVIKAHTSETKFTNFYFSIVVEGVEGTEPDKSVCSLVKNLVIKATGTPSKNEKAYFEGDIFSETIGGNTYRANIPGISFDDAMNFNTRNSKIKVSSKEYVNTGFWSVETLIKYTKAEHMGVCAFASFTYDSYAGSLGLVEHYPVPESKFVEYKDNGWIDYNVDYKTVAGKEVVDESSFYFEIKSSACPVTESDDWKLKASDIVYVASSESFIAYCNVTYYRYLGYDRMPSFLFGTDKTGRDMFTYVFDGLKNSLILGVITFAVCFIFGLLWGSISGYFGGTVDLVMERITDILHGIPWIVLMTIVILHAGQNFGTFAIALCLTGWIGTASTTRTQFYRFRGREYVLASRTLGASDGRLILKHILPNAMGTIITGAVLMIPSVIFSEATISYLGLGFKGMSSLGVILSNNQVELLTYPYLLLFPAAVIALVMISFNLFGNGLRDAINPSLKGEDQ